jgi:hypothetical protein
VQTKLALRSASGHFGTHLPELVPEREAGWILGAAGEYALEALTHLLAWRCLGIEGCTYCHKLLECCARWLLGRFGHLLQSLEFLQVCSCALVLQGYIITNAAVAQPASKIDLSTMYMATLLLQQGACGD